jgi:O-succinylbenzoic acid--CoA ligase
MTPPAHSPDALVLNGKIFYFDEIAAYSFRNSIPINGYEAKVLEFCRDWLTGVQEFSIRTSGSTGPAKLIVLPREQLEASAQRTIRLLGLAPGDRVLVCINTEYIGGMMLLVRGLLGHLPLTILEPTAHPAGALLEGPPFAFASFVPLQLHSLLTHQPDLRPTLNQMKAILVGGAPVQGALQRLVQDLQAPVYHTYGMTETASHIGLRRLNGPQPEEAYAVPPEISLGQDDRGCLTIQGDVTGHDVLTTHDLVELLPENRFRWLGRVDNTLNSGGYKVQVEKVETALAAALAGHHLDRRLAVIGLPDERLGQRVVAIMEGDPLPGETEATLLQALRTGLHPYEVPKEFHYQQQLHQTTTGKLDRIGILQQLQTGAPRNEPKLLPCPLFPLQIVQGQVYEV